MTDIEVANATVAIRGDLSKFHADLKGAERSTQTLGQKLGEALSFKNILKTGAIFGLGTTLPGMLRDLVGFAGDASEAFQDLERATESVDIIFGESADVIEDWAERAADAAGLSKREVMESAAITGQSLKNMGFDAEDAADEVIKLQQRAADLAATFNGDTSQAIDAIGSLLRGERDPIEQFGVVIKEADVNARVLALGLDTSTAAAERQSDIIATLDLFYEQSADSADRFADSTEDVGVQMEKAQKKIENGMAVAGELVADFQLAAIDLGENTVREFEAIGMAFQLIFSEQGGPEQWEAVRFFERMTEKQWDAVEESGNAWAAYQTQLSDALYAEPSGAVPQVTSSALEMAQAIGGMPEAAADQLLANQFHLDTAIEEMIAFMDAALSPAEEVWNARAFLASDAYQQGIDSGIPATIAKAEELRDEAIAVLENASAFTGGQSLVDSWVQGMTNSWSGHTPTGGVYQVEGIVGHAANIFGRSLPSEGPMKGGVASGGYSVGESWIQGISAALRDGSGIGALAGSLLPGAMGSPLGGMVLPSGGGSSVGDININAPTVPMTPRDIGRELRRTGVFPNG